MSTRSGTGLSIPGPSGPDPVNEAIRVRGGASADDVAAIVAALNRLRIRQHPDGYERWRAGRLAALRVRAAR
jgi:hypothetical protein